VDGQVSGGHTSAASAMGVTLRLESIGRAKDLAICGVPVGKMIRLQGLATMDLSGLTPAQL